MKDKIIILIIGILIGAVITTGAFYAYTKVNSSNDCANQAPEMNGGTPPEMPDGQNGQPPEKPNGEGEPPEMQSDSNQTSN